MRDSIGFVFCRHYTKAAESRFHIFTLTLSPDGGEGISRASLLLLFIAIRSLRSRFFAEERVYFISHRGVHLHRR